MDALTAALLVDGYKLDHRRQYPPGTEYVYSNWTPRSSRVDGVDEVVFFGLQYLLKEYLGRVWGEFFAADADELCAEYEALVEGYLGPNEIGSDHIRALHSLGHLPLEFRAVPEGTSVPLRVPMLSVENTHPEFFWLVNYFETLLSNILWMPCTSATVAKRMRRLLDERAEASGMPREAVDFQGHDFSMRGMSGLEAALTSASAHLISFTGTDTVPAIPFIREHYPTDSFIAGSVAATEHSVMCAGGRDDELGTFKRLLDLYPGGILSVVSDTWDLWEVLDDYLPALHDQIMSRDGKLVIRPDSGNPADILCGIPGSYSEDYPKTPEEKGVIQMLWEEFGGTVNEAGYKVLDEHIGAIYGDSINYDRADEITRRLMESGFASTNVVFGMGSYGYQFQTRDTFGFAMKATWVQVDGEGRDIYKDPITDRGDKKSARGRLAVRRGASGRPELVEQAWPEEERDSLLQPVWRDGELLRELSFDEVRENARG